MSAHPSPIHVRFAGSFEFDEYERVLTRDGERIALSNTQIDLLTLFLRKPGSLIRHEEIRKVLWPNRASGDDEAMRVGIYRFQKRLRGNDATEFLKSEPGVGYRFLPEVEPVAKPPSPSAEQALIQCKDYFQLATLETIKVAIDNSIGPHWQARRGFAHRQVRELYQVSLRISNELGLDRQVSLRGLWLCYLIGADYRTALPIAHDLQENAATGIDSALAAGCVGLTLFYIANFQESLSQLRNSGISNLWQQYPDRSEWIGNWGHVALAAFILGRWNESEEAILKCLQEGREQGDVGMAHALLFDTHLAYFRGDADAVSAKCNLVLESSSDFGFYHGFARVYRGWTLSHSGQRQAAIADITNGKAEFRATHSELAFTMILGIEADALANLGLHCEGLSVVAEALSMADRREEDFYKPELLRIQARLHQLAGTTAESERCLLEAIQIATSQFAMTWLLRCVTSLHALRPTVQNESRLRDVVTQWPDGSESTALSDALTQLGGSA